MLRIYECEHESSFARFIKSQSEWENMGKKFVFDEALEIRKRYQMVSFEVYLNFTTEKIGF
jgi:hypothetical protein